MQPKEKVNSFMIEAINKTNPIYMGETESGFFVDYEGYFLEKNLVDRISAIADTFGYTFQIKKHTHYSFNFEKL